MYNPKTAPPTLIRAIQSVVVNQKMGSDWNSITQNLPFSMSFEEKMEPQ